MGSESAAVACCEVTAACCQSVEGKVPSCVGLPGVMGSWRQWISMGMGVEVAARELGTVSPGSLSKETQQTFKQFQTKQDTQGLCFCGSGLCLQARFENIEQGSDKTALLGGHCRGDRKTRPPAWPPSGSGAAFLNGKVKTVGWSPRHSSLRPGSLTPPPSQGGHGLSVHQILLSHPEHWLSAF